MLCRWDREEECNRAAGSLMWCHAGVGFVPFLHMSANKATNGKTLGYRLLCMCRSSEKRCRVVRFLKNPEQICLSMCEKW